MTPRRPSDERLRDYMNKVALAMLEATYGPIVPIEDGGTWDPASGERGLVDPTVFRSASDWISKEACMEPASKVTSGVDALTLEMRKRGK